MKSLSQFLMQNSFFCFIVIVVMAFSLVLMVIPSLMHTANRYQLFDINDAHRKVHKGNISRLGGIAIFCSFAIVLLLFSKFISFQESNYLLISCIILFVLGVKDDVYGVSAKTKFVLQICLAFILVVLGDFRLTSLYGVFNIWDVGPLVGGIFSVVLIIFINNSFNLIDGVDGLAGTIGAIACLSFGIFFASHKELSYAFIAFAMFGAILGFLVFNYAPAKIFMGDTGSLIIGLVSITLAIKFIEINKIGSLAPVHFYSAPAISVAVLIIPIFDSLRIFVIRVLNRKSPFKGDRNHIHHRLLQLGFSSNQIVLACSIFNVFIIFFAVNFQNLGNFALISLIIGICMAVNFILTYINGKRSQKDYSLIDVIVKDTFRIF